MTAPSRVPFHRSRRVKTRTKMVFTFVIIGRKEKRTERSLKLEDGLFRLYFPDFSRDSSLLTIYTESFSPSIVLLMKRQDIILLILN